MFLEFSYITIVAQHRCFTICFRVDAGHDCPTYEQLTSQSALHVPRALSWLSKLSACGEKGRYNQFRTSPWLKILSRRAYGISREAENG
jgi:hypothetical protein